MLRATRPTKMAASHSIVLMKRSAKFCFFMASPGKARAALPCGRRGPGEGRGLLRGLVLDQARLQAFHHLLRILARLLHALGPLVLHRRHGLVPGLELVGRELVDLVAALGRDL